MQNGEFAFAFIKPDGMKAGLTDKIRAMLIAEGKLSVVMEVELLITPAQAAQHYDKNDQWCQRVGAKRHDILSRRGGVSKTPTELGREILASVRETITTAPVHAFILSGENANVELRKIVGDTDPAFAKTGSVRALSSDSFKVAEEEMRPVRNIIHASETPADARKEILNLWPELRPLMYFLLFH
jgi:nucleoside-diphosphate kinase